MLKKEANSVASAMETAGYTHISMMRRGRGEWAVSGICMDDFPETVTVDTPKQWAERSNGATPTPGARLKRPELGATVQHSVTLPESCWQDIEALGVSPKGKNVRSEGVFKLWQAWKAQEGEA